MIPQGKTQNEAIFKPFNDTLTQDNVLHVLRKIDVLHPQIVLNQALLETGHFTSNICKQNNNLFGLYDSANSEYFSFSHWVESCIAYKNMVQNKYKGGCYYAFLDNLPYATDPYYTRKLKYFRNTSNIFKNN
jgi:flagellum-specific peptidoglycan hydrolase FlgJ